MASCPKKIYIYTLSDPESGIIRYVGKTIQKPYQRLSAHIYVSKNNRKKDYCHSWIKSLLNNSKLPILSVIEETFDIKRETYWIEYYRNIVNNLTNFSDGGEYCNTGKTWKLDKETVNRLALKKMKKVFLWNTAGVLVCSFKNIEDCAIFINEDKGSIFKAMHNKKAYKNKYVFSYTSVFPELIRRTNTGKRVLFIKNSIEVIFRNLKEASIYISMSKSSLCSYMNGRPIPNKTFTIKYLENEFMPTI